MGGEKCVGRGGVGAKCGAGELWGDVWGWGGLGVNVGGDVWGWGGWGSMWG